MSRCIVGFAVMAMLSLQGCSTLVAAADTAGTVAVDAVGVAANAAVGAVSIVGKVVGKAADTVVGGDSSGK